jgi:hypothetical protein
MIAALRLRVPKWVKRRHDPLSVTGVDRPSIGSLTDDVGQEHLTAPCAQDRELHAIGAGAVAGLAVPQGKAAQSRVAGAARQ